MVYKNKKYLETKMSTTRSIIFIYYKYTKFMCYFTTTERSVLSYFKINNLKVHLKNSHYTYMKRQLFPIHFLFLHFHKYDYLY